jgi:hypothetical protein
VFELIQRKIDELLGGMCFIEWEAASPQARPRPYVEDVVSYLQVRTASPSSSTHATPRSPPENNPPRAGSPGTPLDNDR